MENSDLVIRMSTPIECVQQTLHTYIKQYGTPFIESYSFILQHLYCPDIVGSCIMDFEAPPGVRVCMRRLPVWSNLSFTPPKVKYGETLI